MHQLVINSNFTALFSKATAGADDAGAAGSGFVKMSPIHEQVWGHFLTQHLVFGPHYFTIWQSIIYATRNALARMMVIIMLSDPSCITVQNNNMCAAAAVLLLAVQYTCKVHRGITTTDKEDR